MKTKVLKLPWNSALPVKIAHMHHFLIDVFIIYIKLPHNSCDHGFTNCYIPTTRYLLLAVNLVTCTWYMLLGWIKDILKIESVIIYILKETSRWLQVTEYVIKYRANVLDCLHVQASIMLYYYSHDDICSVVNSPLNLSVSRNPNTSTSKVTKILFLCLVCHWRYCRSTLLYTAWNIL